MLNSSLPMYNGNINVEQITSEVEVYRDSNGVAYINGKNELDSYFALGLCSCTRKIISNGYFIGEQVRED